MMIRRESGLIVPARTGLCSLMPGSPASEQLMAGGGGGGDPFWANVVFLSSFEGANGATAATDDSPSAHTMTFAGNAQISTAQFKFGTSSLLLDGSGDEVLCATSDDWKLGSGQFTIEGWARVSAFGTRAMVALYDTGASERSWICGTNSGVPNVVNFTTSTNGSSVHTISSGAGSPALNTWFAWCIERDALNKLRIYVDGVMGVGTTGFTDNCFASTAKLSIGGITSAGSPSGEYVSGNLDEIRITKGVARYASDSGYTPSTTAFPRGS